jgi:2-polyprenyl-3-methyl-5-hydroxy-6-metoxy-1,4-benzoquinol methylase
MPSFKQRSYQKELLDRDDIPFEEIKRNMYELDVINQYLGGHAITIAGLRNLLKNDVFHTPLSIVEIGCGGGDNLRAIKKWCSKNGVSVQLTGVDINPQCISYAESRKENSGIEFICSDYKTVQFQFKPDVIFSSLFCHHFTDEELVFMLKWMKHNAALGFFINDLHRHPLAYHSIKILTKLFSKSRLVKNDAPLSVKRGFSKEEWIHLLSKAGITNFSCRWKWAFRWLVTYKNE